MLSNTITRWFTGDMGTPGEYMYQGIHLWSTAAVAAVFLLFTVLGLRFRHDEQRSNLLLRGVAIFQLVFEVFWRIVYLTIKGNTLLCWWPTYPCNLGGILIPLFALTGIRRGKQMFYLFGFVGGCLTFALPEGIFCSDVLSFPILKSILQHTGLLLIPALELIRGRYRPTLKDMGWVVCGCAVHILNCEVIDRFLGFTGDYMFFRSGMPFVIPGVPQFITLSVFSFIVLAVLSFLCDWKGSLRFLRFLCRKLPTA